MRYFSGPRAGSWPLLLVAVLLSAALLWNFHDQHWYPVDEGNYAHVAERLLAGETLHLDVQDVHPGYINFVNAAAFKVFGIDLRSLRYPLMAAAFTQAMLAWFFLAGRDALLATLASVASIALGVLQFLNPTAHWYALSVTVVLVAWLGWVPQGHRLRLFGAGLLVGVVVMFRQLTGVWVAMAVLVLLLGERSTGARGRHAVVARGLVVLMLVALVGYLARAGGPEASGVVLIASWPIAILVLTLRNVEVSNRDCLALLGQLALGGSAAVAPLVAYHVVNGSSGAWLVDTLLTSVRLTTLDFFDRAAFFVLPLLGVLNVVRPPDLVAFVNGLYWLVISLLPAVNGWMLVRLMGSSQRQPPLLPLMAAFYSLVTLHLAGAIYLSYSVGLSAIAVLWILADRDRLRTRAVAAAAAALCVVAVVFHAGQSPFRRPMDAARGKRTVTADTPTCPSFRRSTLRIERPDCEAYQRLVQAIEANTPDGGPIFAVPSDAELYFLAARPNPFRFFNTALGVLTPADLAAVLDTLARHPPRVVSYRPADKYNTEASQRIMGYVGHNYERFDSIAGVELYRLRASRGMEAQ
jgi:hypothetical protein